MNQLWDLSPFSKNVDKLVFKEVGTLPQALLALQKSSCALAEEASYCSCLLAQNVNDLKAKEYQAKIAELTAERKKLKGVLDEKLAHLTDVQFEALFPELNEIRFVLEERRKLAKKRLTSDKEALIEDLSIDGYHAWSNYHDLLVESMIFPFRGEKLSQGQLENNFSKGERAVRQKAFRAYLKGYKEKQNQYGAVLNHISGFRLKMYEARKWDILEEPCDYNRIKPETLFAMWEAVGKNRHRFVPFLKAKAKHLGLKKLCWYDLEAPLGKQQSEIPYPEGAKFILEKIGEVSPKMQAYCQKAFDTGVIESEDRKGKQPGGFCTNFPLKKQARVFMTYSNTLTNMETLAHELGHAFHADCCFSLPYFNQNYAMNVAETASTMAEMIVSDGAYQDAKSREEKLSILNYRLNRSVTYLMNLHARFLFETRFYAERAKGYLLPERLSHLMVEAQKEAYCDSLGEYHPLFWATKLHFYLTSIPFYNFPYTFGYLFSLGIYHHLKQDPARFDERYIALLQDTGRMNTEDLAKKHLNVDLTKPHFWQGAIDRAALDVEEFTRL